MGSSVISRLRSSEQINLILLGLYESGKTSTLYKLKLGELTTTFPTYGFEVETVSHKHVSFMAMDVGGRNPVRALRRHYYRIADGLIFMIDSSDRERLDTALKELARAVNEVELQGVPVLIVANKQDLPGAMSAQDLRSRLFDIEALSQYSWIVIGVSAKDGDVGDMYHGLEWMKQEIETRRKSKTDTLDKPAKTGVEKYVVSSGERSKTLATKVVESLKSFIMR